MESKLKHLDLIQAVINRFNTNSFIIKGWAVTLVSALFALAAKDTNQLYVFVTYIAVPAFWVLDAYYLSQERQYRDLYNEVRLRDNESIDFSMNATAYRNGRNAWLSCLWATPILCFYLLLVILPILLLVVFNR